jgi:aspartyl-tRNA(Asn)/glutamyl-tRNA(Gln) amidotransferase subunit A
MYEKTRAEGFGREVRRRIMIGTYVLSAGYYDAYYVRAQKVRTLIKRDFEEVFGQGVDAILTPATPSAAFAIGEKGSADPVEMYLNDIFTVTVNMAGLPGIAVPGGVDKEGLPLGLQLIGRPFDEEMLFSLAQVIEDAAPKIAWPERWWTQVHPHPFVGWMKGTVQVAPGVDLTDPADPDWGANLER